MGGKPKHRTMKKKHHAVMSEFITRMAVRRFEDRTDLVRYFLDALSNNRPMDDLYGELVAWAATKYEEKQNDD